MSDVLLFLVCLFVSVVFLGLGGYVLYRRTEHRMSHLGDR